MADVSTNTYTQCNRVKFQLYMRRRLTQLADSFSSADRQYMWHDAQIKCLSMNSRKKKKISSGKGRSIHFIPICKCSALALRWDFQSVMFPHIFGYRWISSLCSLFLLMEILSQIA